MSVSYPFEKVPESLVGRQRLEIRRFLPNEVLVDVVWSDIEGFKPPESEEPLATTAPLTKHPDGRTPVKTNVAS